MAGSIMQYVLYLAVLVVLAIPLGTYMKKVMYGEKTIFSSIFTPCERIVCKVLHVQESEDMTWKQYLSSVFLFSGIPAFTRRAAGQSTGTRRHKLAFSF